MSVFNQVDYRTALQNLLLSKKQVNKKFTFASLADAISVQKPYVSRVMKLEAHLNPDQVFQACQFLGCASDATEYLLTLLEHNRSVVRGRREALKKVLNSKREENLRSEKYLAAQMQFPDTAADLAPYYLDPHATLVHAFLSIPRYAANPDSIRTFLGISVKTLEQLLTTLIKLGIIRYSAQLKGYEVIKTHIHLNKDSPLHGVYQRLFRTRSAEHLGRLDPEQKAQYSVTFSADEGTRQQIHAEYLEFLKRIEPLVCSAKEEHVYQLHFDLFRWDQKEE